MSQRSLKELFIGQDREAGSTAGFVLRSNAYRIKARAKKSGGGRGFLDLGNESDLAGSSLAQRAKEISLAASRCQSLREFGGIHSARRQLREFVSLLFDDFIENGQSNLMSPGAAHVKLSSGF